jgi:hypothetical protein
MYYYNPHGYGTPLVGVDLTLQSLPLTTQNINAIFNQKVDDILGEISVFNADGSPNTNFSNQVKEKIAFEKAFQQRKDAILKHVADLIIATGQNQGKGMDQTGSFTGFQSRQGYAYLYDDGRTKVASLVPNHDIDASQGSAATGQATSLAPTGQELLAQFDQFFQLDEISGAPEAEIEQALSQLGTMFSNLYDQTPAPFKPPMQAKMVGFLSAIQDKLGRPLVLDRTYPADIRTDWSASKQITQSSTDPRGTMPIAEQPVPMNQPSLAAMRDSVGRQRERALSMAMQMMCAAPTALQKKTRVLAVYESLLLLKEMALQGRPIVPPNLYNSCGQNPQLVLGDDAAFLASLDNEIARFSVEPTITTKTVNVPSIQDKSTLMDDLPMIVAQSVLGGLVGKAILDKPLVGATVTPVLLHFLLKMKG